MYRLSDGLPSYSYNEWERSSGCNRQFLQVRLGIRCKRSVDIVELRILDRTVVRRQIRYGFGEVKQENPYGQDL